VDDHVHRAYKHKKKLVVCDECKNLARLEQKRYDLRVARGKTDTVTQSAAARKIILSLQQKGFSLKAIERESGVNRETFGELVNRRNARQRIMKSTYDRLHKLLMDVNKRPDTVSRARRRPDHVSSDLARAAVQGLMLRGYPQTWIAEQLGTTCQSISEVLRRKEVTTSREAELVELARKYGTTDGPSSRIRAIAQRRGYQSTVMRDELL